jgi:hypothetical protein
MLSLTRVQRPADGISNADVYRLHGGISGSMALADSGSSGQKVLFFVFALPQKSLSFHSSH